MNAQLLDPDFVPHEQASLLPELESPLRFAIRLRRGSALYYELSFELFGRLFSLAVDSDFQWDSDEPLLAKRVRDGSPRHMLGEQCHPTEGTTLVWDYGEYRPIACSADARAEIYERLLRGKADLELIGRRVRGFFRLESSSDHWRIQRIVPAEMPILNDGRSVLSGRSLDEIEQGIAAPSMIANVLWIEWQHYYGDNTLALPQAIMHRDEVRDVNIAAAKRKIVKGMRKHQARALAQECVFTKWEPNLERSHTWLRKCLTYSGRIEPIDEHVAAVDLAGHSNVADIAHQLIHALEDPAFGKLRYGNGNSKWTAEFSMRHQFPLTLLHNPSAYLKHPIDELVAIEPCHRDRLSFLGYHTIGQVAGLPLEVLRAQFGAEGLRIFQASRGFAKDEVSAVFPGERLREVTSFPEPVNELPPVELSLQRLAHQLAKRLAGNQANEFVLFLTDEDEREEIRYRKFNRPLADVQSIQAVSRILLAQMDGKLSNIVRVGIELTGIEPIESQQKHFFFMNRRPSADSAIRAVEAALGEGAIVKASAVKLSRREEVLKEWRRATGWS